MTIALTHTGHVNHNRFVLLDLRKSHSLTDSILGAISHEMCEKTNCDDVIVIDRSRTANARMRIFGADAREADFCGNGSLMVLDVLFGERQSNWKVGSQLELETRVGTKTGFQEIDAGQCIQFGKVTNADHAIPDLNIDPAALQMAAAWRTKIVGFRIAGEPHLILKRDDSSDAPLRDQAQFEMLAENIFNGLTYDGGVNITILMNPKRDTVDVMTFERGVRRLTQSCGSGAVAVASYLSDQSQSARSLTIKSPGGQHRVEVLTVGGTVHLSADVVRNTQYQTIANSILAKNFLQVSQRTKPRIETQFQLLEKAVSAAQNITGDIS